MSSASPCPTAYFPKFVILFVYNLQANLVYRNQLNLVLTIGAVVLGNSNTILNGTSLGHKKNIAPPKWNDNEDCEMNINEQLTALKQWEPPEHFGAWHVFEDCYLAHGTSEQGLAHMGGMCSKDGQNTAVTYFDFAGGETWRIFAQELGHNFGAHPSFEKGIGKTGGIMDYGDGKLNGVYQFNTEFRKAEMCKTINTHVQNCPQGFQALEPVCGNGILDDGETCECRNGENSCQYCDGCQLQPGKMCSPEGLNMACCWPNGQLADTSVLCKKGEKQGTCIYLSLTRVSCTSYSVD